MTIIPTGFFAYPGSPPRIAETIRTAVTEINRSGAASIKTWEENRISGKLVIREICKQIDNAQFFCADITGLNPNVMFELGYAIGTEKRIWLILDTSLTAVKEDFKQLRILTTTGYSNYINSGDLISGFYNQQPHLDTRDTIFDQAIKPSLPLDATSTLLYLKTLHDTDASRRISRVIQDCMIPKTIDDPKETTAQSLTWYGTKVYSAEGVVCHLANADREGAKLHNARYSLIAGIAHGMKKPLLMLEEGNLLAPIDYRDMLYQYQTANEAVGNLVQWLDPIVTQWNQSKVVQTSNKSTVKLAKQLQALRIGEPLAENEVEQLVEDYFVETASYREAMAGTSAIFVGRKGSGKSANLIKLAASIRKQPHSLVCQITPSDYEYQGIIRLLSRYTEVDLKGYAIEGLWKFLIYTEIANAAAQTLRLERHRPLSKSEERLLTFLDQDDGLLQKDFSIRLEQSVEKLLVSQTSITQASTVQHARLAISEAVHDGVLNELRSILGEVLAEKKRVAVLIDNLDKAWDKRDNLDELALFLLGLLNVTDRILIDLKGEGFRRKGINISLAVFLRSDIFFRILGMAKEPDKIKVLKLNWDDDELLLRVIEERFISSREGNVQGNELWTRFFCSTVKEIDTKKYLLDRTIHRPRDLVVFVKAAITTAVNRGHPIVEEKDVIEGERQYSQHAFDSLVVEGTIDGQDISTMLYEFMGANSHLHRAEVEDYLRVAAVPDTDLDSVIDGLCTLSFLGVEVKDNDFRFANDPQEHKRNQVLARKLTQKNNGITRYMINRPFWAFLEVKDYYA